MFSSMIRMPSVRKAKEKKDVGGQEAKEETNWNHLPNELKHACVKEMTIETRWKLRQTSHSNRALVDSVRLYADSFALRNNFFMLTRNRTTLMINFKFHRSKYIPFLVYIFTVLEMKRLYPDYLRNVSFWNVLHKKLPHGEGTLRAKEVEPPYIRTSDALKYSKNDLRKIKIRRSVRDVCHEVFRTYSEAWIHLNPDIDMWQAMPPEVGYEFVVYDPELTTKKLQKFIKYNLGKYFLEDGYEQAYIGTVNLERIIYLYREVGSNWYHIVMRAVEPDDFVNTERWKEMKTFNYKPKHN